MRGQGVINYKRVRCCHKIGFDRVVLGRRAGGVVIDLRWPGLAPAATAVHTGETRMLVQHAATLRSFALSLVEGHSRAVKFK